jgi:hypothetical protein
VHDRPRVADEIARRAQLIHDGGSRLGRGQSGQRCVERARPSASVDSQPGVPHCTGRSVPSAWITARTGRLSSRHHVTSVTSPKVQIIAMPLPSRVGKRVGHDRHPHAEERGRDVMAEQRLVARIVRMRDERHACRNQLGPRRFDLEDRPWATRLTRTAAAGSGDATAN